MTAIARHTTLLTLLGATLAQAATLPAETCTSTGAGTRTCELSAEVGTLTLPGGTTVPAWGYTLTPGTPRVPGPVLIVRQGETVTVNFTNQLPEPAALFFHGQALAPDLTGAAASGGTTSYQFVASAAGTFLYEAGLTSNSAHQVAMGLYGVLIVRPAATDQVYPQPNAVFDDEALVVLGEVDPALNTSTDPAEFDMRDFSPKFFLINGKAYPDTDAIPSSAGRRVLLRYANAGLANHSMSLLGLEQVVLGLDGNPKPFPGRVVAESLGTGQTLDVITTVPDLAPVGSRFPLYDASFTLHNDGAAGFGGMLTFLSTGAPGGGATGPQTSMVAATPNPTEGSSVVVLTATITNAGGLVAGAEYFFDVAGPTGTGVAMTALDGAFNQPGEVVSAVISPATLAALSSGGHLLLVRGRSPAGVWGSVNFGVLQLDKAGPLTTVVTLMDNPTNGTNGVFISATGDDRPTGGSLVEAGEYFIDASGAPGTGAALVANVSATEVDLTGTVSAATLAGLTEGEHTVSLRSRDALGNWGPLTLVRLMIDRSGPAAVAFGAQPNPNDGHMAINSGVAVVRLTASFADPVSAIAAAEAFLDTPGPTGTGLAFMPSDGRFDSLSESAFAEIPLGTISFLSVGPHTFSARARDAAGNWGALRTLVFVIDRTGPNASLLSFSPNPTNAGPSNNTSFTLSARATDVGLGGSNIVAAEWFSGPDPGVGLGTAVSAADGSFNSPTELLTANINFVDPGWPAGPRTISVRARDAARNWSPTLTGTVTIVLPDLVLADGFESRSFAAWNGGVTGSTGLRIATAAALEGTLGMRATLRGTNPRYLTDNRPSDERSYHARFLFNPNSASTGGATQTIFAGRSASGQEVFSVDFRRTGSSFQVRGTVQTSSGARSTPFVIISNGMTHSLELAWGAGSAAAFDFTVDGTLMRRSGVNTNSFRVDSVRLGPSGGLATGAVGDEFFDGFVSTRRTVIGP